MLVNTSWIIGWKTEEDNFFNKEILYTNLIISNNWEITYNSEPFFDNWIVDSFSWPIWDSIKSYIEFNWYNIEIE